MNKFVVTIALFLVGTSAMGTTWTINNSGSTFSPSSVTITDGDDVNFVLSPSHNAREVSQATWNANGTTALPGGFETPFGGGVVLPAQLGPGTHYYVCVNHGSGGMKGVIIVQSTTGIEKNLLKQSFSVFPNPTKDFISIGGRNFKPGSRYSIIDRNGREVIKATLTNESGTVDISQLSAGIYFFRFEADRRETLKIIKN